MNIEWVQPVTFKKKKHDWVGQIELQGTSVEIVCKHIWGSKPRDGIVAGDVFVRKIERAILKAIDYCDESTLSVLSEALGELYNQHWRPKGGRNIKPDKLTTELKLARIDFSLNSRGQIIVSDLHLSKSVFAATSPVVALIAAKSAILRLTALEMKTGNPHCLTLKTCKKPNSQGPPVIGSPKRFP